MEALKKNKNRIISVKKAKKIINTIIFIFLFDLFLFPMPTLADEAVKEQQKEQGFYYENNIIDNKAENNLPENKEREVDYVINSVITAYNSEVGQCDDSPCITANGFNLCKHGKEDTIATNFLKLGTKIKIPDLFGDRVFVVRDRMNKRYSNHFDVWMLEKQDARNFGVKMAKIQILN